jgi:Domain of unknown function (DUF4340)
MKARWLVNLLLLLVVAGVALFIYKRPAPQAVSTEVSYEISDLKLGAVQKLVVEPTAKAGVTFEKINGYWMITKPYSARADQMLVQRVLSLVAAKSKEKFPADDLAKFGLDAPRLKVKLDEHEFLFGTYNPVSEEQYVLFNNAVYLLPTSYADYAQIQLVEFLDKSPMKPNEKIVGFNFSHLEQWQDSALQVDMVDGKWIASSPKAKPDQNEMNDWFESYWSKMSVREVEPYTPDRKANLPYFEVNLADGSKVHFDKLQESPEFLLGRPDEGMLYHLGSDIGFTLLNPPVNMAK